MEGDEPHPYPNSCDVMPLKLNLRFLTIIWADSHFLPAASRGFNVSLAALKAIIAGRYYHSSRYL